MCFSRWSRWLSCLLALLAACSRTPETPAPAGVLAQAAVDGDHMVSIDMQVPAPAPLPAADKGQWPAAELQNGQAWISCATDYTGDGGDGTAVAALDHDTLHDALAPCADGGLLRLRYAGKINDGFAELVRRVALLADAAHIDHRILDLDSSGGQVESAVRAGDAIGESGWTIWVREGSICHSACVFVLAAGDNRLIAGQVGIHRMMRISSTATSRAELNRELQEVYANVKDYLQRNGVAVAVADLMMTVPNRSVRLLTHEELREYGLDGTNAVQDDLDRIRQMRKCGEDFVRRKDAFLAAFERQCRKEQADVDAVTTCGQALKQRFGFPDPGCPQESPLAEADDPLALPRPVHAVAGTTEAAPASAAVPASAPAPGG
ncbi:hypothetical protein [Xanthomonas massiliensis]|uniref:COG3904 family protein n=1 Tax=Xanthomonas massiliensis TaxID=1720302 RepID=UPI000825A1BF|nr:hypothetical protein [Xanthomonas massiliensis]